MEEIKVTEIVELDIKRFYLPLKINVICHNCGNPSEIDLDKDYISYPTINDTITIGAMCIDCGECFELDAILNISLKIDRKTLRKS